MHLFMGPGRTFLAPEWAKDHLGKSLLLGFIPRPVSLIVKPPARSEALRDLLCYDLSIKQTIDFSFNMAQIGKGQEKGLESLWRPERLLLFKGLLGQLPQGSRERSVEGDRSYSAGSAGLHPYSSGTGST